MARGIYDRVSSRVPSTGCKDSLLVIRIRALRLPIGENATESLHHLLAGTMEALVGSPEELEDLCTAEMFKAPRLSRSPELNADRARL